MNYTQNHHLPQWVGSDPIRMKDFNQMNQDIEAGLDAAASRANAAASAAQAAQSSADAAEEAAASALSKAKAAQPAAPTRRTTSRMSPGPIPAQSAPPPSTFPSGPHSSSSPV